MACVYDNCHGVAVSCSVATMVPLSMKIIMTCVNVLMYILMFICLYTWLWFRYFCEVDVCKYRPGWCSGRTQGQLLPSAAGHMSLLSFSLYTSTEVDISLYQTSSRSDKARSSPDITLYPILGPRSCPNPPLEARSCPSPSIYFNRY